MRVILLRPTMRETRHLHEPTDGFRGNETNGTAAIGLQPVFSHRVKLKKQPILISYPELCECYCALVF